MSSANTDKVMLKISIQNLFDSCWFRGFYLKLSSAWSCLFVIHGTVNLNCSIYGLYATGKTQNKNESDNEICQV